MECAMEDRFARACQRLEKIAELKEQGRLDEAEYQDFRDLLLREMKQSAVSGEQPTEVRVVGRERLVRETPSFGQQYALIVQRILTTYKSAGKNPKERDYRALGEMAEKQALHPGDYELLSELIETVHVPANVLTNDAGEVNETLLKTIMSMNDVAMKVRDAKATSPATHAICDTAQQSVARAVSEYRSEQTPPAERAVLSTFWNKWVLPDVSGALNGGATGAGLQPAFTPVLETTIPIAAAFGAIIGAGITSGRAIAGAHGDC